MKRLVLAVSILSLALVAGCGDSGGGGSSEDARALIDKAFKSSIPSADMTLNIQAEVKGIAQPSGYTEPLLHAARERVKELGEATA